MAGARKALVVATYDYRDTGLRRLAAPEHDAESLAAVLADPDVAGFDVTTLVNEPHHVVGEAIADFYAGCLRDDLALLYFSGHGLKDDEGRLHLAMSNTRREALLFTAISAAQLNDAMDASASRRKVLILDCCYSGAFPAGRVAKSDEGVQTLERFQGKGRAVLTASDATQYAFEGDSLTGAGSSSVFTRYLVEAIRSGAADLDEDGDIALDELYSYVRERVVAEVPQQRPKKQEDVDGRILIARNVHWKLPAHLRHAVESPIAAQRLSAVDGLAHLHRMGNDVVRAAVAGQIAALVADDSRSVSAAATALLDRLGPAAGPAVTADATAPGAVPVARAPGRAPPPAPVPAIASPRASERALPSVPTSTSEGSLAPPGPVPAAGPSDATRERAHRAPDRLVLGLLVFSALPLTLSRLQVFEVGDAETADEFNESTLPWTLLIVLPLVVAAGLLAAHRRFPRAQAMAFGLVLGSGLVLVEDAAYWIFFFAENSGSYPPGPALPWLVVGAALVAAAGVVLLARSSLSGRAPLRRDWRVACGFLVVACTGVFLVAGPETETATGWLATHVGTLLLGAAALPVTLLWLRPEQRTAALVAVVHFGLWSVYFPVQEIVAPRLYLETSVWLTEIVCAVLILLGCCAAQAGPARTALQETSGD
jgi:hypothetical protein